MLDIPPELLSEKELLAKAKAWHVENRQLLRQKGTKGAEMDLDDLIFQWDSYALSKNKVGNQVITVPIVSKGASKANYIELGLIVDDLGRAKGMIKEYMRSPYTGKTQMNIYTGTGRLFLSGVYDARKQNLKISRRMLSGVGKLDKLAKIASSGNSGSDPEEPLDGGEIEGVDVYPPGGGDDGGGGGGYEPDWPDDNGGGSGDSGGGGGVPTNPGGGSGGSGETPQQQKQQIVNSRTRTDCDATKLAQKYALRVNIQSAINTIKDEENEWGVAISLADPNYTSLFNAGTPYTDGKPNSIHFNPRWDSTNGYTTGFIHNHPAGSAPSPSDVYGAMISLNTMVYSQGIPTNQLVNYIDNYASMVVSNGYVYTISVKNALYVSAMKDGYDNVKERKRYEKYIMEYYDDNNIGEPSALQKQQAGESALLQLFGEQIHITKHEIGETNNSKVLKLDNDKKVKSEKPC